MNKETLGSLLAGYETLPTQPITRVDAAGVFILTKDRDGVTPPMKAVETALKIGYTLGYNDGATMRDELDAPEGCGRGARA